MNNGLLQEFLRMRANLKKSEEEKKKKMPRGIKDLPDLDTTASLAKIIEEKPAKKHLDEYFKKRCAKLCEDI